MDIEETREFLQMLRDLGVTHWDSEAFTVRFGPVYEEQELPQADSVKGQGIPQRRTMFEEESLWPGGQIPRFQTKDR